MSATQREHFSLIDADTGGIEYKEPTFGTDRSTEDLFAVSIRLGNVSMIGWLAAELRPHFAGYSLILDAILFSGSHSGDFIRFAQLDELEKEIRFLRANQIPLDPDAEVFLSKLERLIVSARSEQNAIVFL